MLNQYVCVVMNERIFVYHGRETSNVFLYSMRVRKLQSDKCVECSGNSNEGISSQKCSGVARAVDGSHSFTCHKRERNEQYLPSPSQSKLVLIYRPRSEQKAELAWVQQR